MARAKAEKAVVYFITKRGGAPRDAKARPEAVRAAGALPVAGGAVTGVSWDARVVGQGQGPPPAHASRARVSGARRVTARGRTRHEGGGAAGSTYTKTKSYCTFRTRDYCTLLHVTRMTFCTRVRER